MTSECWLEKSNSRNAKCRICGERITDEHRIFSWASRGWAFFHIDCIKELSKTFEKMTYQELSDRIEDAPHKRIRIDKL